MLELLKARFSEHRERHPDLEWSEVEHRLRAFPAAIAVLRKMEESGGEPDTIGYDEKTGKLIFCDCAKESPSGRMISAAKAGRCSVNGAMIPCSLFTTARIHTILCVGSEGIFLSEYLAH